MRRISSVETDDRRRGDTLECENARNVSVKLPNGKILRFCRRCADAYARSGELPLLEERRDYWSTPPAIVIKKPKQSKENER